MTFYFPKLVRHLLEEFENAFDDMWPVVQEILDFIKYEYNGDKEAFLADVSSSCDYFSASDALRAIFGYSEK